MEEIDKKIDPKKDKNIEIIIKKAREILNGCDVYLFGSRARGDNQIDSDYDILLVIKNNMPVKEKIRNRSQIRSLLAKEKIYADIIIQSEADLKNKKKIPGNIIYYVMPEAILL